MEGVITLNGIQITWPPNKQLQQKAILNRKIFLAILGEQHPQILLLQLKTDKLVSSQMNYLKYYLLAGEEQKCDPRCEITM